jgi:hypothetical protein
LPDGQKNLRLRKPVQPSLQKYFASPLTQIKSKIAPSRTRKEGRLAIVTDVGSGMRWTHIAGRDSFARRAAFVRTAKSCGSGAPMQALSERNDPLMTVAKKLGHREEHEGNR